MLKKTLTIAAAAACAVLSGAAVAQAFPSKPVTIIVPFSAGGTLDGVARLVAAKMTESMGQTVLVENRTGAGGIIGLQALAKSAPDGYTIGTVANSFVVNAAVRTDLPFDSLKDFTPVTSLGITPHVLAVHPSFPGNSVKDLVALAKKNPGTVTYGTIGQGSYSHLVGKMFEKAAGGMELVQVPYRGSAPSITALMGNQITMVFGNLPEIMPQVRAGKLKALALSASSRLPQAPELPTMTEAGFPGFHSESWYGLVGPAGMPAEVVKRLQQEVARAMAQPDAKERLAAQGVFGGGDTPEEFSKSVRELMATYAAIAKETNITASKN